RGQERGGPLVALRPPVEMVEAEAEGAIARGANVEHPHAGGDHFAADAVPRYRRNAIRLHAHPVRASMPARRGLTSQGAARRPGASAANPKGSHTSCGRCGCELRVQSGTRIIELLVSTDSEVRTRTCANILPTSASRPTTTPR